MSRSQKLYTYLLPIIIVLNGYASGVEGLSIGSIIINAFNVYAIILFFMNRRKADRFFGHTVLLLTIFSILSCADYLLYGINDSASVLVNTLKIITWFVGVTFTATMLFDYSAFKHYYIKFCVVCTVYLLVQMLSWNSVHIYLPNLFDFGPVHPFYEQYSSGAYVNYLSSIGFGRFSSFFAEPAYYGIMMVIGLVITLFDNKCKMEMQGRISMESLFLILGIWLSTSTAAIIFVIFVIAVYFFKTDMRNKLLIIIIAASVGIISVLFISDNSLYNFFIEKITTMGTSGRIGYSYGELSNLTWVQLLLGVGLGNIGVVTNSSYVNEITGLLMEYGIIGFSIFLWYLFKLYKKEQSTALHVLIIIYIAAMAQGGYLFNLYGILIFSVALSLKGQHENR